MKETAISIRSGNVIEYEGRLCVVLKNDIVQPGKGNAIAQLEIRDIRTGSKINARYRTQEMVERVRLEQDDYQYLYSDGEEFTFMNQSNFEQINITKELLGEKAGYLQESMIVEIESYEGEPLGIKLPPTVVMEIVEAEPVVKGQTATTSYKPAITDTGIRVMVPPYIDAGTRIVVKTEDGTFVERAKD
jgi:elongation factor P